MLLRFIKLARTCPYIWLPIVLVQYMQHWWHRFFIFLDIYYTASVQHIYMSWSKWNLAILQSFLGHLEYQSYIRQFSLSFSRHLPLLFNLCLLDFPTRFAFAYKTKIKQRSNEWNLCQTERLVAYDFESRRMHSDKGQLMSKGLLVFLRNAIKFAITY